MIPIYQTKLHNVVDGATTVRGNCYAACWASILEIPLEEVPRFEELPDDGSWFMVTRRWLRTKGLQLVVGTSDLTEPPADRYVIAAGPTIRGLCRHAVVYRNGRLEHDPHPSAAGLMTVEYQLWAALEDVKSFEE